MPTRDHCGPCFDGARAVATPDDGMCGGDGFTRPGNDLRAWSGVGTSDGRPRCAVRRKDGHSPVKPPPTPPVPRFRNDIANASADVGCSGATCGAETRSAMPPVHARRRACPERSAAESKGHLHRLPDPEYCGCDVGGGSVPPASSRQPLWERCEARPVGLPTAPGTAGKDLCFEASAK